MPFFSDCLVRDESLNFTVEVTHCSLCPLGEEGMDQTGDFTGVLCSVTDEFNKTPDCFETVLKKCPLKGGNCKIVVKLVQKKDR